MRKKIFAVLICFLCAIMLCGCGSINYTFCVTSDGTVTQTISLSVSKSDIEKSGSGSTTENLNSYISMITSTSNQVVTNMLNNFLSSHADTDELKTFDGGTKTFSYIKQYVLKNIEPSNGSAKIVWKESDDGNILANISFTYLTIYAYKYFYNYYADTKIDDDTVYEDNRFYVKEVDSQTTIFNEIAKLDSESYTKNAKPFLDYFSNQFSLSDMTYSFTYSTPDSKIYSDADEISTDSSTGNTLHTWNFTASDLSKSDGDTITTYDIKIRAWIWYVSAILITLIVASVLSFVCILREKKLKKMKGPNDKANFDRTSEEIRKNQNS